LPAGGTLQSATADAPEAVIVSSMTSGSGRYSAWEHCCRRRLRCAGCGQRQQVSAMRPTAGNAVTSDPVIWAVLPPERRAAAVALIAVHVRGHRGIENKLHYVRSPGVLRLSHDVVPDHSAGSICNTSRGCGPRCCRCSEAQPARTCHMYDNLAWRRRVDDDASTCTIR
jgi:hypothetical protein